MLLLLLVLYAKLFLSVTYAPENPDLIVFGQSCPLDGPNKDIGMQYRSGIVQAFEEANNKGGILGGKFLSLHSLDDGYDPTLCLTNTNQFLANSSIFALLGYVGTPTTQNVFDLVLSSKTPLLAPLTGAKWLRSPFNRSVFNVRSSYEDEASTMIHYLIRKLVKERFSILYQDDSFGSAAFQAVNRTLVHYGKKVESQGTYVRNTANIDQAYLDIAPGNPDVIFLAGTYEPCANLIQKIRQDPNGIYTHKENILFVVFSFAGTKTFTESLVSKGVTLKNIMVSEVVPNIMNNDYDIFPILEDYHSGRIESERSFKSFEGYIVGKTVTLIFKSVYGSQISRSGFLDQIYSRRAYDLGGVIVGKLWDGPAGCNQGLRHIYPVKILSNGVGGYKFESITEAEDIFQWTKCLSEETYSYPMLQFKQSASMTGNVLLGYSYHNGMRAGIHEYNKKVSISDRFLGLEVLDDQYDPSKTVVNTATFLSQPSTFGFAGYVGTPTFEAVKQTILTSKKPFIGGFTGSNLLREVGDRTIINIRNGYDEEIGTLLQSMVSEKYSKFSFVFQDDEFGKGCARTLNKFGQKMKLKPFSNGSYDRAMPNVDDAVNGIFDVEDAKIPEVVFIFGTAIPATEIIKKVVVDKNRPGTVFALASFVGSINFRDQLLAYKSSLDTRGYDPSKVYISEVIPFYNDSSKLIVQNYLSSMSMINADSDSLGFVSFEGYVLGRLIGSVLGSFTQSEVNELTSDQFISKIYSELYFNIDGLRLGPFSDSSSTSQFCNSGIRSVWMTNLENYGIHMENGVDAAMTFSGCRIDESILYGPVFFGQSVNLDVEKTQQFTTALEETLELDYGKRGSNTAIFILSRNNKGSSTTRDNDIMYMKSKESIGLVGFEDNSCMYSCVTEVGNKPMVAPLYSAFGQTKVYGDVYYFRPFLFDEVYYLNEYFKKINKKVHAVCEEISGFSDWKDHLTSIGIVLHYGSTQQIIDSINNEDPDVEHEVVMFLMNDITQLSPIYVGIVKKPVFVFPSKFDDYEIKSVVTSSDYYVATPFSRDSSAYNIYKQSSYYDSILYKDLGYYAFIIAKFLAENQRMAENTKTNFFDNLKTQEKIRVEDSVDIGPFNKFCNQGVREIYIYDKSGVLQGTQQFSTKYCSMYGNIPIIQEQEKPKDLSHFYDYVGYTVLVSLGIPFFLACMCCVMVGFCVCCIMCAILDVCCGISGGYYGCDFKKMILKVLDKEDDEINYEALETEVEVEDLQSDAPPGEQLSIN